MGKRLKKYVIISIIKTIILYAVVILFLTIFGIEMIKDNGSLFFLGLDVICIVLLINKINHHISNIKNINLEDFKKIEKELHDPILIVPFNYILTDTYIVNLRNSHLFKYKDIETMYKRVGFKFFSSKYAYLSRYLWTITKDKKKDKFFIGYVGIISDSYWDFSDIIQKKNIWVNFNKNRE